MSFRNIKQKNRSLILIMGLSKVACRYQFKLKNNVRVNKCNDNFENILNKSENATPELFAIYIQNYANQECN